MRYSAGSITLKGFTAFQIIPGNFSPIIMSNEIIITNKPQANNMVTIKSFNRFTYYE